MSEQDQSDDGLNFFRVKIGPEPSRKKDFISSS